MKNKTIVTKHRSINSRRLFELVDRFVMERFDRLNTNTEVCSDNVQFNISKLCSEFFEELKKQNRIDTYQVICDARNNCTEFQNNNGYLAITLKYRQRDCLNTTRLCYEVFNGSES